MCRHPASQRLVPGETAHVARLAFPHGSPLLSLRDKLGPIFDDGRFAHLLPAKGQPAEAPWHLALVTLLLFKTDIREHAVSNKSAGDLYCGSSPFAFIRWAPPGEHMKSIRLRLAVGSAAPTGTPMAYSVTT
jgi:hypothetical protein